uniref:Uncharacterized protein n=1 Tax=Acrobeloides nanus TaxID=290746 RepID=A0A914BWE2_9BILA
MNRSCARASALLFHRSPYRLPCQPLGKVYNDLDELVADVKVWIASKDRHFFTRGIDLLRHKWEVAIEVDSDYPPE